LLRVISSDCSDGKQFDDNINDMENEVVQTYFSEDESSDSDSGDALEFGAAVASNNVSTEAKEEDDEQIFQCKDGSSWQALAPNQAVCGRLQQRNMRFQPAGCMIRLTLSDGPLSVMDFFQRANAEKH